MARGSRGKRWIGGLLLTVGGTCLASAGLNHCVARAGETVGTPSPVLPASLIDTLRPDPVFDAGPPATPAAERVLATLARVEERQRRTRYQHHSRVDERRGVYLWDCSGMVNWVLRRAAPRARRGLGRGRPLAMDYARRITRAPADRPRRGWQRVRDLRTLRPGDVFAWESRARFRRYATGHVGFVMSEPRWVRSDLFAIRMVDSTTGPHQGDTRAWDGVGGTGWGTMTFQTGADGAVIAYGWWGTESPAYVGAEVVFGRVH